MKRKAEFDNPNRIKAGVKSCSFLLDQSIWFTSSEAYSGRLIAILLSFRAIIFVRLRSVKKNEKKFMKTFVV